MTIFVKGDKVQVVGGVRKGQYGEVIRHVSRNGKPAEVVIKTNDGQQIAPATKFVVPSKADKHDIKEGQWVALNGNFDDITILARSSRTGNFQDSAIRNKVMLVTLVYNDPELYADGDIANVVAQGEFLVVPVSTLSIYPGLKGALV